MGYIYKVTNCINKKVYIGMKTGEFDIKYYGSGKLIKSAIEKYGIEYFILQVIDYAKNKKDLSRKEKYWIKTYRMFLGKSRMYNIHDGGEGGNTKKDKTKEELDLIYQKVKCTKIKNGKKQRTQKEILKCIIRSKNRIKNHPNTIPNNKGRKHSGEKLKNITAANHMRGKMWITNGNKDKAINKNSEIPDGWYKGKSIKPFYKKEHKQESKNMISDTMRKNKRICYTNGIENKWIIIDKDIIPEGWYKGMTKNQKNYFYINDGISYKKHNYGEEIPSGWIKGVLRNKKHEKN